MLSGTGTNCCYVEDLDKVELWTGDKDEPRQVSHPAMWPQWLTRDGQSQQARCPRPWPRGQYFGISLGLGVEANI